MDTVVGDEQYDDREHGDRRANSGPVITEHLGGADSDVFVQARVRRVTV